MASLTKNQKKIILQKCKNSFIYFCENFCKIKHPNAGIIPFRLFKYQKKSIKAFKRHNRVIYRKCRQSGISTLTGAYALWIAMFHTNRKVLIVSKRDEDAIGYLNRNVKFVYEYLPEWMHAIFGDPRSGKSRKYVPLKTYNEHTIEFFHGSDIRSLTSSKDTLRSNTASLVIVDEAAFIYDMEDMWCVSDDTLISVDSGLECIGDILSAKSDDPQDKECFSHDLQVDNGFGLSVSDKVCYNGYSDTIKIRTALGYEIEATPGHSFKMSDYSWNKLENIKVGDNICLKSGGSHNSHGNIDHELAELLGYYFGDGTIDINNQKRIRLCCDPLDCDLHDYLLKMIKRYANNPYLEETKTTISISANDHKFIDYMTKNDFVKNSKHLSFIPKGILESSELVKCAFVRGLFEADGYISKCGNTNKIGLCTISEKMHKQLKLLLLNIGIKTKSFIRNKRNSFDDKTQYELFIYDQYNIQIFKNKIGFLSKRKNSKFVDNDSEECLVFKSKLVSEFIDCIGTKNNTLRYYKRNNRIKLGVVRKIINENDHLGSTELGNLISNGIFTDEVVDISYGHSRTVDISVPSNNTYIANGFVSHNTAGQPTLMHGGRVIVISTCVSGDSFVFTDNGIKKIKDCALNFRRHNNDYDVCDSKYRVGTISGIKDSFSLFKRKSDKTIKIVTEFGTELVAHEDHVLTAYHHGDINWHHIKDLEAGSYIACAVGSDLWGSNESFNNVEELLKCTKETFIRFMDNNFVDGVFIADSHEDAKLIKLLLSNMGSFSTVDGACVYIDNSIRVPNISQIIKNMTGNDKHFVIDDVDIFNKNGIDRDMLHKVMIALSNCVIDKNFEKLGFMSNKNVRFERITSIENDENQETYDFEVPDTEHFLTNTVISHNTNGKGNWYHNTWEDSVVNSNGFYPIQIPWWNMDWVIEWYDELAGKRIRLAPCDGIVKCTSREDKLRYGDYKSPWLEQQYRELQENGEAWKFRQEILMEFIGSGNTVLDPGNLVVLERQVDNSYKIMKKSITYSNDNTDVSGHILDFNDGLFIWEKPIRKTDDVVNKAGKVVVPGEPGHKYCLGADISSGEDKDYSAIQIIDVTVRRQVAELKIKCDTSDFAKMIDFLGRYYNNALAVVENTGIGKPVVQDLKKMYYYPNLFYRRLPSGKKDKKPGFPTTNASKPDIVKALTDNVGIEDDGVLFRSSRLLKEANSFVHLGNGKVGNEPGTNNNDDLMIAAGLSCIGIMDALETPDGLIPTSSKHIDDHIDERIDLTLDDAISMGGRELMFPIITGPDPTVGMSMEDELNNFINQLGGGRTMDNTQFNNIKATNNKKKYFK